MVFGPAFLVADPMHAEDSWPGSGSSVSGATNGAQRERTRSSSFSREAAEGPHPESHRARVSAGTLQASPPVLGLESEHPYTDELCDLSTLCNHSVPQFPHLSSGVSNPLLQGLSEALHESG